MHPRVVGDGEDEPAVGAGDGAVHEGVGGDVEPDVFHADQGAFAGPTHAQGFFVGDLLVGGPEGVDIAGLLGGSFDKFEDLGRGRAGVGIDAAHTGVDRTEADRLVTKQNLTGHESLHSGRAS